MGKVFIGEGISSCKIYSCKKLMSESGYYVLFFMPFCFCTDNFTEQNTKIVELMTGNYQVEKQRKQ